MRYINFLRTCYPKVLRQVSFHFVYPISYPMRESEELAALLSGHSVTCEQDPKEYLQFLLQIQVGLFSYITNFFRLKMQVKLTYNPKLFKGIIVKRTQITYSIANGKSQRRIQQISLIITLTLQTKVKCLKILTFCHFDQLIEGIL